MLAASPRPIPRQLELIHRSLRRCRAALWILPLLLLAMPATVHAQFNYAVINGAITITGYTGSSSVVSVPGTINAGGVDLPVTSIGNSAFYWLDSLTSVTIPSGVTNIGPWAFNLCTSLASVSLADSVTEISFGAFNRCYSLTNLTLPANLASIGASAFSDCHSLSRVTIPDTVTNIGSSAFGYCSSLTAITVDAENSCYSGVDGVLFNYGQTLLLQYPAGNAGSYTIPGSVTSIGSRAFAGCSNLTSVTIPSSVTNIGYTAFTACPSLTAATFTGNRPTADDTVFFDSTGVTVYYLPGTTGWGPTFGRRPTALWFLPNPLILDGSVGVQTNEFGFIISWATNISVVVEACTDLAHPTWYPLQTNTLTGGSSYFSDASWKNYPARFYRIRLP